MKEGVALIIKSAQSLNKAIKDSEEYERYLYSLNKVKENQELYQAMNTFRKRNFELQSYRDGVNRYQEIHDLAVEYEKILRNPLVNDFLVAEQVISRKLEEVYELIVEGLVFDYSYME